MNESATTAARRRVERAQLGGDHLALADQQRRGGAGVQRDLEALARLGVELAPVPAGEPGDERRGGPSSRPAAARSGPWITPRARPRGRESERRPRRARLGRLVVPAWLRGAGARSGRRPADDRRRAPRSRGSAGCRCQSSQLSPTALPISASARTQGMQPSERQHREAPERHPRDAGRQRDEGADDRQHPGEEDGGVAVALEPAVGPRRGAWRLMWMKRFFSSSSRRP